MYEKYTFEFILNRMLDRVAGNIDKREGSVIYDACAPAAAELAQMYAELDINLNLAFADTASGEYLRRRAADYGVAWQEATKAQRLGLFYDSSNALFDVPIGNRLSIGKLVYGIIEKISTGQYVLECETAGVVGNADFGNLLPIDYIADLARAELADVLIPGEDDESDDALRERLFSEIQSPGTSGNISDYVKWALSVAGVGAVQVVPLWDGPGTVRVVIIDSERLPASSLLVDSVQDYISPVSGTGEGAAPIGADVTVAAAEGVGINVAATVVLSGATTLALAKSAFEAALTTYLQGISFAADPSPKYVRIGSLLLDIPGVLDFSGLLVNGGTANVPITTIQVAILGAVTLSE